MNYDNFHLNTNIQRKIISENNFTYRIIFNILNNYLPNKMISILDIGSGAGTISLYLGNSGYKVMGLEISKKAVDKANQSAKLLQLNNVIFKKNNFLDSKLNSKFDTITCFEVIEHLSNDKLALDKMNTLLKTNGLLILSTPSKNAPMHKLGLAKEFDKRVGHLRRYTEDELRKLFKEANFEVIQVIKTEGIIRNFLFLNPIAGKFVRFIKWKLVDVVSYLDNISMKLFGESDIFVIAKKR